MSESFRERHLVTPSQLAADIDRDFRSVAETFPSDLKAQPAGSTRDLCRIEGVGRMAGSYLGKTGEEADGDGTFVIGVSMVAEGHNNQLGFSKHFNLTHGSFRTDGPVFDPRPTQPEDLDGCPGPLETLSFTVRALTEEYGRLRGRPAADVLYMNQHRQTSF